MAIQKTSNSSKPVSAPPAASAPEAEKAKPTQAAAPKPAAAPTSDQYKPANAAAPKATKSADEARLQAISLRESRRSLAAAAPPADGKVEHTFTFDTGGNKNLTDVQLKGSWNKATGGYDAGWGGGDAVKMYDDGTHGDKAAGDGVYSVTQRIDAASAQGRKLEWGVTADVKDAKGNVAKNDAWMLMEGQNQQFSADAAGTEHRYSPTDYRRMGLQRQGQDGVVAGFWAPDIPAQGGKVSLDVRDASGKPATLKDAAGKPVSLELKKNEETGVWSLELPQGWKQLDGKFYKFKLEAPGMSPTLVKDPYSRETQGQYRGFEQTSVNLYEGTERPWYESYKNSNLSMGRFEVSDVPGAKEAFLVLKDESGKALGKDALLKRFGTKEDLLKEVNARKLSEPMRKEILSKIDGGAGRDAVLGAVDQMVEEKRFNEYGRFIGHKYGDYAFQKDFKDYFRQNWDGSRAGAEKLFSDYKKIEQTQLDGVLKKWDSFYDRIQPDGRIAMAKSADDAFRTFVPDVTGTDRLKGLAYEFQVYGEKDGKRVLLGDKNNDGKMSAAERKATAWNDPYNRIGDLDNDGKLSAEEKKAKFDPSSSRWSVARNGTDFQFQHQDAPRMAADPKDFVIYEMHAGSFLSAQGDKRASTIEDIASRLDQLKELGVNTLEMLPMSEFAGKREWGYTVVDYFAGESGYGFQNDKGQWVNGSEALKQFVDLAHSKGFNVLSDVVYNHMGDRDNAQGDLDGKRPGNPYFNWGDEKNPRYNDQEWGMIPAYNKEGVRRFFRDNAAQQLDEFGFDGLRFDFTRIMHTDEGGGADGMKMMQEINRTVHMLKPGTYTTAEELPDDRVVTKSIEQGGAGFDTQWHGYFNFALGEALSNRGGKDKQGGYLSDLMRSMTSDAVLDKQSQGVNYLHSHDSQNAAGILGRIDGDAPRNVPSEYARAAQRLGAGLALAAPGNPMLWMGEETLNTSKFQHGRPETWGVDRGWELLKSKIDQAPASDRPALEAALSSRSVEAYQRLAQLPAEQRAGSSEYRSLTPAQRGSFEDYLKLDGAGRDEMAQSAAQLESWRFHRDAIAQRRDIPALRGDGEIRPVSVNEGSGVMSFTRTLTCVKDPATGQVIPYDPQKHQGWKTFQDEALIVANFDKNAKLNYGAEDVLPNGQWKEVFNSDGASYGGGNVGNAGGTFDGYNGSTTINVPAGGYVIFHKMG